MSLINSLTRSALATRPARCRKRALLPQSLLKRWRSDPRRYWCESQPCSSPLLPFSASSRIRVAIAPAPRWDRSWSLPSAEAITGQHVMCNSRQTLSSSK